MDRKTYEKASEIVSRIDEIEKELTRIRDILNDCVNNINVSVLGAKLFVRIDEKTSEFSSDTYEEEIKLDCKDLIECLTNRANRLEERYQRGISAFDKL